MASLMKLLVSLGLDSSNYSKGLKNSEKEAKTSSQKMSTSLMGIGSSMQKVGGKMSLFMTAPIVAGLGASINSSSDLMEAINKTEVVFKENGQTMLEWSNNSAKAFGLSKSNALDAAAGFGAMFDAMGVGADQTMEMSQGLIQLAADMGSLYNVDPSEMLEKLRSGMAGEAEPLRVFGVMITEANVKAQALKMGLGDITGALSDQEKALARYALIQDQASIANGDFINTADGMANSTRIMKAEMENLSASFGESLMPVAIEFMRTLIPILDGFNNLDPAIKKTVVTVLVVIAALGPLITIIGTVVSAIGTLIGFFGSAGAGGTALAGIISGLTGVVIPGLIAILAAVTLPVWGLIAAIGALIAVIVIFGKDAWDNFIKIRNAVTELVDVAARKLSELGGAFGWIGNAIRDVIAWALRFQQTLFNIHPPAWLTPGSPTPFELGLVGIGKQLSTLAKTRLPQFNAELQLNPGAVGSIASNISGAESTERDGYTGPTANEIGKAVANAMMQYGLVG